jgi:hypothetical protein
MDHRLDYFMTVQLNKLFHNTSHRLFSLIKGPRGGKGGMVADGVASDKKARWLTPVMAVAGFTMVRL